MKSGLGILMATILLLLRFALARAESNDSPEALANAETQVQLKVEQFAQTNANYELLLHARKLASSMNPRGDNKATLSALDEASFRLQLRVLLALAKARDPHYDRNAPTNHVYLNLTPPLSDSNGMMWPSGIDPKAIKDAKARKAYEEAIAENNRRNERLKREMALSRGVDYALIDIWVFVKRGLPQNSVAQNRAIEIVAKAISDNSLLERFNSKDMPGLIW